MSLNAILYKFVNQFFLIALEVFNKTFKHFRKYKLRIIKYAFLYLTVPKATINLKREINLAGNLSTYLKTATCQKFKSTFLKYFFITFDTFNSITQDSIFLKCFGLNIGNV